jgi:predicted permease
MERLTWWRRSAKRLQLHVWRRAEDDRDLDDEIRFHLAEEERLRIEAGARPAEAAASARRAFGNVARVKEVSRTMRTWMLLETIAQDLRFGFRTLRRNRAFALFGIGSLALGIGATTAIFSLFDAIVLRPLAVPEPHRLVTLSFAVGSGRANNFMPYPHFARMRDANRTLEGIYAWTAMQRVSLGIGGRTEIVSGVMASGGYHATLGLQPAIGRLLTLDDDQPGGTAAVISHGYWQRRFGGIPSVIGTSITLNQVPFTIVGVEPRGFTGMNVGSTPDVTIPLRASDRLRDGGRIWEDAFATWIEIMGRIRPGVPFDTAAEELKVLFSHVNTEVAAALPANAFAARVARDARLFVQSGAWGGQSGLRASYERWLALLLGMLASVVLLASLNVATLLLARSEARRHEIATRLAIGAGRQRVVRQLTTEAFLIAGSGAVLGLLFASWASRYLLRLALPNAQILPIELTPDLRVAGFTILISAMTCLLFGVMPALRATAGVQAGSTRGVGGRRGLWLERTLVASQTALSLALLVCAALFVRSLQKVWAEDPGYDRRNVLMFSVDAGLAGKKGPEVPETYARVLDELQRIPAARFVSLSSVRPVSDTYYFIGTVTRLGDKSLPEEQPVRMAHNQVSPGYFATLGIPIVAGRDFDRRDVLSAPCVAIVSEILARRFEGHPVGQTIGLGRTQVCEVVGVAKDARYARVKEAPRDVVYLPIFQSSGKDMWYSPTFEIRYAGAVDDVMHAARESVARIDPTLTVFREKTLEVQTIESLSRERLLATLSTYLAGFALLLACIGLYGLMTYVVRQRTPELGLRMALGARPAGIRGLVLKDSAATTLAGLAAGFGLSLWAARLVDTQLYQVQPTDPLAVGVAVSTLLLIAFVAAYFPALQASRIDPVVALRRE